MVQTPRDFQYSQLSLSIGFLESVSAHALHTERINLSPFTKDFRVWGASNEYIPIYFGLPHGSFINSWITVLKHTIFELDPSSEEKIFPILLSSACNCNWTKVMSISRTQVRNSLIMTLDIERKPTVIAQIWAFRNCLRQLYFKSKWRGIGYSFQLAITAPLYSITGYCIATAQSCLMWSRFHRLDILPCNPCWNQKITLHGGVWKTDFRQ